VAAPETPAVVAATVAAGASDGFGAAVEKELDEARRFAARLEANLGAHLQGPCDA
jgi:hypothetical protein